MNLNERACSSSILDETGFLSAARTFFETTDNRFRRSMFDERRKAFRQGRQEKDKSVSGIGSGARGFLFFIDGFNFAGVRFF